MPDSRLGEGLERIRARRRTWLELVGGGVVLACLVNLFAGALWNYLDNSWKTGRWGDGWGWTVFFALLLALSVIGVVLYLCGKKESEDGGLTLVLPIYVDKSNGTAEILFHPDYAPAQHGSRLFAEPGAEFRRQFALAWPGNGAKDFEIGPGHSCWDALVQLVQALILQLLKMYGEMTLTKQVRHHSEFRHLAGGLGAQKFTRKQWPAALQTNIFLQAVENLRLPQGAGLSVVHPPVHPLEPPGRLNLVVSTKYCSLTFSVSPYWSFLGGRNPALGKFADTHAPKAAFLAIPLEFCLELKGHYLSHREMTYHYLWFQTLIDQAKRRLSWGQFLKHLRHVEAS